MEVEEIILNKEYFELSAEEMSLVTELAENEQAYNDLKWFLGSTKATAAASKIEPSDKLRKSVFAHLEQPAGKRIWLNGGAGAAIGTPKKKIYQMPMFQVGIAACIVAGFFLFANPFGKADQQLALNDISKEDTEIERPLEEDQKLISEDGIVKEEEVDPDLVNEQSNNSDDLKSKSDENIEGLELNQPTVFDNVTSSSDATGAGNNRNNTGDFRTRDQNEAGDKAQNEFELLDDVELDLPNKDAVGGSASAVTSGSTNGADFYKAGEVDKTISLEEKSADDLDLSANAPVSVTSTIESIEEEVATETVVPADEISEISTKNNFGSLGGVTGKKKEKTVESLKADKETDGKKGSISIAESSELTSLFFTVP